MSDPNQGKPTKKSQGFVCPDDGVQLYLVEKPPTVVEGPAIDDYVARYEVAFGRRPHGLHYIPLPGHDGTVAVFIPIP